MLIIVCIFDFECLQPRTNRRQRFLRRGGGYYWPLLLKAVLAFEAVVCRIWIEVAAGLFGTTITCLMLQFVKLFVFFLVLLLYVSQVITHFLLPYSHFDAAVVSRVTATAILVVGVDHAGATGGAVV